MQLPELHWSSSVQSLPSSQSVPSATGAYSHSPVAELQLAFAQTMDGQATTPVAEQAPLVSQAEVREHASPSSHGAPGAAVCRMQLPGPLESDGWQVTVSHGPTSTKTPSQSPSFRQGGPGGVTGRSAGGDALSAATASASPSTAAGAELSSASSEQPGLPVTHKIATSHPFRAARLNWGSPFHTPPRSIRPVVCPVNLAAPGKKEEEVRLLA